MNRRRPPAALPGFAAPRVPAVRRVVGPTVVLAVAATVSACGPSTMDGSQLGTALARQLAEAGHQATVTCPDDQPATEGTAFTCTADLAEGTLVYDVTITSGAGEFRYDLAPGQHVAGEALAAELTDQIRGGDPALAAVSVTCPATIVAPGGTVDATCTAVGGTTQLPVQVVGEPGRPLTWSFVTG